MNDLDRIISESKFELVEGVFVYAKVRSVPSDQKCFMVTRDKDEITVVVETNNLGSLDIIERNELYKLIALNVSVPFCSVGFLAKVSQSIANEGANVLIVSTYSKDYVMVKEEVLGKVLEVLKNLGFQS